MKVTPPWSRRCATQPQSVTSCARVVWPQLAAGMRSHRRFPKRRGHVGSSARSSSLESQLDDVVERHRLLHAVDEAAQRDRAVGELPLPDDRRERGAGAIRHLELRLEGTLLERVRRRDALGPQLVDQAQPGVAGLLAQRDHEARRCASRWHGSPFAFQREQHAVEPHGEPDPGRRRAPEGLREAVVSPARVHGAGLVRREHTGDPFERRARVVVESTHHAGVEHVRDPGRVEPARTAAKWAAQSSQRCSAIVGRCEDEVLVAVDLAVEHAKGVPREPGRGSPRRVDPDRARGGRPAARDRRDGRPRRRSS